MPPDAGEKAGDDLGLGLKRLKYKKADIIVGTEVRKSAGFVLLIISYSSQR